MCGGGRELRRLRGVGIIMGECESFKSSTIIWMVLMGIVKGDRTLIVSSRTPILRAFLTPRMGLIGRMLIALSSRTPSWCRKAHRPRERNGVSERRPWRASRLVGLGYVSMYDAATRTGSGRYISRTVEYGMNDFAVAQVAKDLAPGDYAKYLNISANVSSPPLAFPY